MRCGGLPVEMLLHHLGDGPGHGSLLGREALVEVDAQLLLQEVDDELGTRDLLVVVLHPGHLPLRRQPPIKVVLRTEEVGGDERRRPTAPTGWRCCVWW